MQRYFIGSALALALGMLHANAASAKANSVSTQQPKIPTWEQKVTWRSQQDW